MDFFCIEEGSTEAEVSILQIPRSQYMFSPLLANSPQIIRFFFPATGNHSIPPSMQSVLTGQSFLWSYCVPPVGWGGGGGEPSLLGEPSDYC